MYLSNVSVVGINIFLSVRIWGEGKCELFWRIYQKVVSYNISMNNNTICLTLQDKQNTLQTTDSIIWYV